MAIIQELFALLESVICTMSEWCFNKYVMKKLKDDNIISSHLLLKYSDLLQARADYLKKDFQFRKEVRKYVNEKWNKQFP